MVLIVRFVQDLPVGEAITMPGMVFAPTLVLEPALDVPARDALKVVGDSMIDVGIIEGDILIVERKTRVKSGDIVVALLEGETTVKRYLEKGGKLFLVPENSKMKPIAVQSDNFSIQGKVVGLQRRIGT